MPILHRFSKPRNQSFSFFFLPFRQLPLCCTKQARASSSPPPPLPLCCSKQARASTSTPTTLYVLELQVLVMLAPAAHSTTHRFAKHSLLEACPSTSALKTQNKTLCSLFLLQLHEKRHLLQQGFLTKHTVCHFLRHAHLHQF